MFCGPSLFVLYFLCFPMTSVMATDYLCYKWVQLCYVFCNTALSSFLNFRQICRNRNTTDVPKEKELLPFRSTLVYPRFLCSNYSFLFRSFFVFLTFSLIHCIVFPSIYDFLYLQAYQTDNKWKRLAPEWKPWMVVVVAQATRETINIGLKYCFVFYLSTDH